MRFVWFYVAASGDGEELKHSIRSVCRHFSGQAEITVIGDKPKWYTGHHIPVARAALQRGDRKTLLPWRDTSQKIQIAADHPEVPNEFCWIMDDVYLLRSVSREDLLVPRYDPWYKTRSHRDWHKLIRTTFDVLRSKGYGNLQYGTHLPHVFEKAKLLQMFEEFDFRNKLLLFEILYGNRFRENAIHYTGFLKRLLGPQPLHVLNRMHEQHSVLNYTSGVWRATMQQWIRRTFCDPSPHES